MGWARGGGVIWPLRVQLTRTRTAASSTEAKSENMRVSERVDKRMREVQMNDRLREKVNDGDGARERQRDGLTQTCSTVTRFSMSSHPNNSSQSLFA